ncbi:MAG: TRAP transporter small permease [Deltaproteobacteria bacterium]|jgi:TRAP-type C4-dicarboxylate transport system permease small subunit|nr:TRAP transporter small permease [Deltaproteobacteria bacterium]
MNREIGKKADRILGLLLRWGSTFCLVGLLFLVSAVVFFRFVPLASTGWTDEVVEFAFAWMVFLCSAELWRQGTHFRVEVITDWLGDSKAGRILKIMLSLLCLAFLLVLTYEGAVLALKATDRSPIFEFPKTLWYLTIPISGAIMLSYTVRDLWRLIHGHKDSSPGAGL